MPRYIGIILEKDSVSHGVTNPDFCLTKIRVWLIYAHCLCYIGACLFYSGSKIMRSVKSDGTFFSKASKTSSSLHQCLKTLKDLQSEDMLTPRKWGCLIDLLGKISAAHNDTSSLVYKVASLFLLADTYVELALLARARDDSDSALNAVKGATDSLAKAKDMSSGKRLNAATIKNLNTHGISDCDIALQRLDELLEVLIQHAEAAQEPTHRLISRSMH